MTWLVLFLATAFLAYSNGANDNFKGVASLYGSRTASYRTALSWATVTTFAGSIASIFAAQALLKKFSGKGLVPDALVASESFLLAVVIGASLTVILATATGFPVSTTHGLTGALVGCGLLAVGPGVNFAALQKSFLVPLLLSPAVAILLGGVLYLALRSLRRALDVQMALRLTVPEQERTPAMAQPAGPFGGEAFSEEYARLQPPGGSSAEMSAGAGAGGPAQRARDLAHFASAGVVCFARALNDTPKIVAMLLLLKVQNPRFDLTWGFVAVALAMAAGGVFHSRKIAETMSQKITGMNPGQGFAANLTTGFLVILASVQGLPVSTTHVAVGSLFGIGLTTGRANPRVMLGIVLSWIITLPCAALIGAAAYWMITRW